MSMLEKIFSISKAKKLEKKGDDAHNSKSAIIFYEEAIHYLKMRSRYYEINVLSEKIGKVLLKEARKTENPFIERNRSYQKAYEIFNNTNSSLKEETAIEHCILSCTEATLQFYKNDILSNKSLSHWQDFILKLSVKASSAPEAKIFARLLLKEFLEADSNIIKPSIINFIESFNLADKHKAEMYLTAAAYHSLSALYRSDMYKLASLCYRRTGYLTEWISALEGQYMLYLGDQDFNYLIDDNDIYDILKLSGEDVLKDFFYNMIPYFLSDIGRIIMQDCLNQKEYWTIFCKALIKQIRTNGLNSVFKEESLPDIRKILREKLELNPEIGLKLGDLIGFSR